MSRYTPPALLCFIESRVRKIKNEASSHLRIFCIPLYYVASSPGSPLPHLLVGHKKFVGSSAIPARSCPGRARYPWGSVCQCIGLFYWPECEEDLKRAGVLICFMARVLDGMELTT